MTATLLALDLGTTTLAGHLLGWDGTVLAAARCRNPQSAYGADVIRRLEAASSGAGAELQQLLANGIDTLLRELTTQAGVARQSIRVAACAANPAISTLLCNDEPRPILFPPYRPRSLAGVWLTPADLGLELDSPLYRFPLVSGYVGGDLVAFLHAQATPPAPTLFIDIGTNAEMALFTGERWLVTSVAAGPAFEGGGIGCGMLAGPGAIGGVTLHGERLQLEVIGGGVPLGICGSGLTAALAAAVDGGLIDGDGRIVDPEEIPTNLSRYVVRGAEGNVLRLYRDAARELVLTQAEVRAFQLAKGAVHAGTLCLLQRAGMAVDALQRVVISGAFGQALRPQALKSVAMLPADMVKKSVFVPDGVLAGVGRALLADDGFGTVQALAERLKPYPLSGTPAFERAFLAALNF